MHFSVDIYFLPFVTNFFFFPPQMYVLKFYFLDFGGFVTNCIMESCICQSTSLFF
jgi:hypothetical protein